MTTKEQLLAKFYRRECSRQEMELLMAQLEESDDGDYSGIMAQLWERLKDHPDLDEPVASRILQNTLQKLERDGAADQLKNEQNRVKPGKGGLFQRLSIAAGFLVIIAVAAWIWWPSAGSVEIHTAYGEQRTITLPDQSTVKLNANSTISFYGDWQDEEVRQVWLEGEAYFQVKKDLDNERKFEVITRDLTVEVLGTIFNVNTREQATMVFLEEGKVQIDLEDKEEAILMDPGEVVTYSVKTRQSQKRKIIREEAPASWKDGTIILQKASLQTIMQKMEEIYGVTNKVNNQTLLNRTFNFPMPIDNLDTAFLLLKESTGLEIEKRGNELIVK